MNQDTSPKSQPWLAAAVSIAICLLGAAVQWGTVGADVRSLERRVSQAESQVSTAMAAQAAQAAENAALRAELSGMRREIERLTRAVETMISQQIGRPQLARDER